MSFLLFCYRCVFINQKGSPFYIFRHCATFSERKIFLENFKFFSKKNVLRFLSLRYSADLRRSRLVLNICLFSEYKSTIILVNTIRIFDVKCDERCVPLKRRSMFENIELFPNYDVISEVNCVLLRRKPRVKKVLPCDPVSYIRIFQTFSEHESHPLCVLTCF